MPTPTFPHARLQLHFTMGASEEMITTIKIGTGRPDIVDTPSEIGVDATELLAAMAPAALGWVNAIRGQRTTAWVYDRLSVYSIGADGLAYDQAELVLSTPVAGTGSGAALPLETAMVVTLLTGAPGARRRGRSYLGGFVVGAMDNSTLRRGYFVPGVRNSEGTAFAGFLSAINDAAATSDGRQHGACVVSNASSPPSARWITQVRVGDVPDVQRRRSASQIESYATTDVVL